MKPRIIDIGPRQFSPQVAAGSMQFMRFLMGVHDTLSDGTSSWRSDNVEMRSGSAIEGKGLFATVDIQRRELLAVKGGRVVNEAEVRKLTSDGILHGSQQQIGFDLFLVGLTEEEEGRNLIGYNHSCNPNAFFGWDQSNTTSFGTAFLFSRKAIPAGQEITADYSVSHISDTHRFVCNCQSPDCRVIIQPRFDYLHSDFQEKYKGEFPDYVQALIDDINAKPQKEREALLFSARFGETVGRIRVLSEEMERLESILSTPDDTIMNQRIARFRQALILTSAFLIGTFSGVAETCGIDMSSPKKIQESIMRNQAVIVSFAKKKDDDFGWIR